MALEIRSPAESECWLADARNHGGAATSALLIPLGVEGD